VIIVIIVLIYKFVIQNNNTSSNNKSNKRSLLESLDLPVLAARRVISGNAWSPTENANVKRIVNVGVEWTGDQKRAVKFAA